MKEVFIRGNDERSSEVIKMLEDLGGVNNSAHEGAYESNLYYVNTDNQIDYVESTSKLGIIIQECFEELHLPEPIKKLPNTWEEWVEQNPMVKDEYYIGCSNILHVDNMNRINGIYNHLLSTKEDAEATLALIKLKRLRDTYRQGWEPDYVDDSVKYVITCYHTEIRCDIFAHYSHILSFQSAEIRDKFYANFKDLIEQAKEFI